MTEPGGTETAEYDVATKVLRGVPGREAAQIAAELIPDDEPTLAAEWVVSIVDNRRARGFFLVTDLRWVWVPDNRQAETARHGLIRDMADATVHRGLLNGTVSFTTESGPFLVKSMYTPAWTAVLDTVAARTSGSDPTGTPEAPGPAAEKPAEIPAQDTGPRTITVHALGPSGSGKTVLMAGLYHRLRIRRPELAFYLKSDHASSVHLNAVYNTIADPDAEWPEASRGVQEWLFTTCLQAPAGDFEPLRFRYVDYPGGVLTNPRAAQDETIAGLVEDLRSANALLVLLDGQAMLDLLEGGSWGRRYLGHDITSSLEIAQQSRCPVHFVVTKWDLLDGRFTLADLRDRLLADPNVGDFVTAKQQDVPATLRLIAVSAVGPDFAQAQDDGRMLKTGARIHPVDVEVPLMSVVPDFLHYAHEEILARQEQLARQAERTGSEERVSRWQPLVHRATSASVPTLRKLILARYPRLAPVLTEAVFQDALDMADRMVRTRAERRGAERRRVADELMASRQDVDSERAALQLFELQCENVVLAYEEDHPASVLGGGLRQLVNATDR